MERQRAGAGWITLVEKKWWHVCKKAQYKALLCECDLQRYTVKDNPGAAAGGVGGPQAVIDL